MENPIKTDDLGVPLFLETPLWWHPRFSFTCVARVARPAWASVRRLNRSSGLEASDPQGRATEGVLRGACALRLRKRHFLAMQGVVYF